MKTKGVIIDLRCYPAEFMLYKLSEYFMPKPKKFVQFSSTSFEHPGLFIAAKPLTVGKENPNYYRGKVVIIVNENTISQAEFTAMALQKAPKATVLGSTTAAADGNVSFIQLPGNIITAITGLGVYYEDGRETQRVGVDIHTICRPTIAGIKDGRDELLEKALELLS